MGISLDKIERKAPELLSLAKTAQKAVDASALKGRKARMALALDYSGSMMGQYRSGAVQKLTDKILALSTQLDDDGEVDVFLFSTFARYAGTVSLDNFRGAVGRLTGNESMGSTNYAALFQSVLKQYGFDGKRKPSLASKLFGSKKADSDDPVLVVFVTDGEPDSRNEAKDWIRESSRHPVFYQFISIGPEVPFLNELDTMTGRTIDNANYKAVRDINRLTEDELFGMVLDEYPSWLDEIERLGWVHG